MCTGDISETTLDYTAQRRDTTGLLYYTACYDDPALGTFLSLDTLVPGAASGAGGGAATIGPDARTALAALTVGFHEPGFLAGLNAENAFIAERGFFDRERKSSTGPGNPQALNRYAYVLNNPVQYTDPSGHGPPCDAANICGKVKNVSKQTILIYGSKYVDSCNTSDPRCSKVGDRWVLDRVVVKLRPGQHSDDLGMRDVDGIVERVSGDGKGFTGFRVFDGETAYVTGRKSNGEIEAAIIDHPVTKDLNLAIYLWRGRREELPWDHMILQIIDGLPDDGT